MLHKSFIVPLICLSLLALTTLSEVSAQERSGFLLRINSGIGSADISRDLGGSQGKFTMSGQAFLGQLTIGGFIMPNLALHGTVYNTQMFNPSVEDEQMSYEWGETDATISAGGLGAGLTYYFMPTNVYISATAGFAFMQIELKNGSLTRTEDSDTGVGGSLVLGKEWFVSERWSLGLGAQFDVASIPISNDAICIDRCEENVTSISGGLVFSATLN